MKRFLFNIFLLFLALVVVFLFTEFGTSALLARRLHLTKEAREIKYFVIGHSHSEMAYNDSIIKGLKNISYSGESYLTTFYKAKLLLEKNPQIDTIFVEFSNNYLDQEMDEWIWGSDFLLMEYLNLSPTVSAEDKWWLFKKNPPGFLAASSLATKVRLKRMWYSSYDYNLVGGFRYLIRDKTDSLLEAIPRNAPDTIFAGTSEKFSTQNLRFLRKLIHYCENNGIKLYLIRSPLHKFYFEKTIEKPFDNVLERDLPGVEFLDFSRFPASNTEFGDLSHLNYRGTRKFSVWLDSLIQSGFLNKSNKQKIIDKEFYRMSLKQ